MLLLPGVITTGVINGTCTTAGLLPRVYYPRVYYPVFITGVITGGTTAAPTQHPPLGYVLLVY